MTLCESIASSKPVASDARAAHSKAAAPVRSALDRGMVQPAQWELEARQEGTAMDLQEIRRQIILALFSDNELLERLVLKGGNALALVHRIGLRVSLDLDFSVETDLEDIDLGGRIEGVLGDRFTPLGFTVFDARLKRVPPGVLGKFSGYDFQFKLIESDRQRALAAEESDPERLLQSMRRQALEASPTSRRIFQIQISKNEYCGAKQEVSIDDYIVYVYTPEMIALEKLRAICQQHPAYTFRVNKTPRARDFYDIYAIVTERSIELATPENLALLDLIFAAKEVPVELLSRLEELRRYHEVDWQSVKDAVGGALKLESFDFYFDFVRELVGKLEAKRNVHAP